MKKITLLFAITLSALITFAQWEIQVQIPDSIYLRDVFFYNNQLGWIVGNDGVIFKTMDSGETWTNVSVVQNKLYPWELYLYVVYFVDSNHGWISGFSLINMGGYWGMIYKTNDGGNTWTEQLHEGGYEVISGIYFKDTLRGIAVSGYPGFLYTDNGGENWDVDPQFYPNQNCLCFYNDTLGWSGARERIYHTENGGETWELQLVVSDIEIFDIYFVSENIGFAVGGNWDGELGKIYSTIDGGEYWLEIFSCDNTLYGVFFVNDHYGWTVGESGTILYTINGGETWIDQSLDNDNGRLESIFITDEYQGWVAGSNLYHADLSLILGVAETGNEDSKINLIVSPNPFPTSTTIEYEITKPSSVQLTIYDYLGKQVESIETKQAQGKQEIIWNTESLPNGLYFCVIKTNQGSQTAKLVKL